MTDRFADINSIGESGRNPITNAGRVAINGHVNEEEIIERKDNYTDQTTLFPGPTEDTDFAIYPRELCIEEKIPLSGTRNRHKMHAPYVLSVVNAGFKKGEAIWAVTERLDFRGIAGGQGAKYDSDGQSPEIDLALVQGGLSTLRNTGPKRIPNNTWIYWSLPDPKSPYDRGIRGSTRQPYWTMPYEPKLDRLSEYTLAYLMSNPAVAMSKNAGNFDQQYRFPIQDAAVLMREVVAQIYLDALHTFLTSGLVRLDAGAFENARTRAQNAISYTSNRTTRTNILRLVGAALGVRDVQRKSTDPKITFRPDPASETETTLGAFAVDVFLARKDYALMVPLTAGTRAVPTGDSGNLLRNQTGVLSDLFAAINRGNEFTTRRIFAKTMSPAEPGKEMDVLLQRYSS